jgi:hypothetical protein
MAQEVLKIHWLFENPDCCVNWLICFLLAAVNLLGLLVPVTGILEL